TFNTSSSKLSQNIGTNLCITFKQYFTGISVYDVFGQCAPQKIFSRHFHFVNVSFFQQTNMTSSNTAAFFNNNVAFFIFDIESSDVTTQARRHNLKNKLAVFINLEITCFEKHLQHLLRCQSKCTQ